MKIKVFEVQILEDLSIHRFAFHGETEGEINQKFLRWAFTNIGGTEEWTLQKEVWMDETV